MARPPARVADFWEERSQAAAAPTRDLETARLTRAMDAGDFHEYVAELRGRIARDEVGATFTAVRGLGDSLAGTFDRDERLAAARCDAFVEAGGMAAVLDAVQTFRSASSGLFFFGCAAITVIAEHVPPSAYVKVVVATALRLSLVAPPAGSDVRDKAFCYGALACLLCSSRCRDNVALCKEALAAGAIERLLEGCAVGGACTLKLLQSIMFMCWADEDLNAECTARVAAVNGLDVLIAAMRIAKHDTICVDLLHCLLRCPMSPVTAEKFRARETAMFNALLAALTGPSRTSVVLATNVCLALGRLVCAPWLAEDTKRPADRFGPRLVMAAVDGILAAMRVESALSQCHSGMMFPTLGPTAATVLQALMGSCGGTDAVAPGTYLLRAGALPLFEAALSIAEADLSSIRNEAKKRDEANNRFKSIKLVVYQLRNLAARADAAAAELIAEEEAAARSAPAAMAKAAKARSKSKGGKAADAFAAKSAIPQPLNQRPPTAASSTADAAAVSADAAEPPRPTVAPSLEAAQAPPPLPPWLLAAMQRLPPPSAAPPADSGGNVQQLLDVSCGDCVICLDAAASVRTRCCAKQGPVFCAPCAALLAGDTRCALCGVDAAETAAGAAAAGC